MNESMKQVQINALHKVTAPITCLSGRSIVGHATGFFFRYKDNTYLITNRHVFIHEVKNYFPDKITIRLNKKSGDLTDSGELTYDLYELDTEKPIWLEISPEVDLAALKIEDPEGYMLVAFLEGMLPPPGLQLGLGEQVLVIGYPKTFYDDIHNLPIVRSASISSAHNIPFRQKPIFLIDSRLHPGTSGSPVITVPKSIYENPSGGFVIGGQPVFYLLGVNSGEFGDLQLNAVWYSNLIIKLLNTEAQRQLDLAGTK